MTGSPARAGLTLVVRVRVVGAEVAVLASRMVAGTTPVPPKTTDPVDQLLATGRYSTFSVQLVPGVRVMGGGGHVPPGAVVKPLAGVMVETVSGAVPVFVKVTLCVGLATPAASAGKVRIGSTPERTRALSWSAMERFPNTSVATERGEFRAASGYSP